MSFATAFVGFDVIDRPSMPTFHRRRQSLCSRRRQDVDQPSTSRHNGGVPCEFLEGTEDRAVPGIILLSPLLILYLGHQISTFVAGDLEILFY